MVEDATAPTGGSYMKERLEDQMQCFDRNAITNQGRYRFLKCGLNEKVFGLGSC